MINHKHKLYIGLNQKTGEPVPEEWKDRFLTFVSKKLEAFTVLTGQGYWQGAPEPSLILEYIDDKDKSNLLKGIALVAKEMFNQEAVLLTVQQNVEVAFI